MKRFKILIVNANIHHGGAERQINYTIKELIKYNYSITVIYHNKSNDVYEYPENIRIYYIPWYGGFKKGTAKLYTFFIFLIRVLFHVLKEKYDIIHTYDPLENILAVLIKIITGIPCISSVRTNKKWAFKFVNLWGMFSNRILTNSKDIQSILLNKYKIKKDKIAVIRNGIDINYFKYNYHYNKNSQINSYKIGIIGRISRSKNQLLAIKAFNKVLKLNRKIKDLKIILIGKIEDEKYLKIIENTFESLYFNGNLEIRNWMQDIISFYNEVDLIVLPSRTEGLPNVIIEAMAVGMPWIASDVADVRFLSGENCERGLIFEDNNIHEFILAIERMLSMEIYEIEQMCKNGREFIEENISLKKLGEETAKLYSAVLNICS